MLNIYKFYHMMLWTVLLLQCSEKKWDQNFFCHINLNSGDCGEISYTVSWINLLQNYIDSLHLTSVMSLALYNLKCSSRMCYHWVVRERNSRIYPTSSVASKFARFESSWLQRVGLLQEKVYKICITDLNKLKQQLWMEWAKLDHVFIAAAIHQWRRQ